MTALKRLTIVLVIAAILIGILEIGLRFLVPSMIEGGTRIALRAPQDAAVTATADTPMLLHAVRWRIEDVSVTADQVPLSETIDAEVALDAGSLPLIPAFGSLRDGTATFTIAPEQLGGVAALVSGGLAEWGEMREGQLVSGGVLTDQHFDLPHSPEFEIGYEADVELGVENGEIVVTPTRVSVADSGPVGSFLTEAMTAPRSVCIADRLPAGITLTGIDVQPSGEVTLQTDLSPGLLSSPSQRVRGSCA